MSGINKIKERIQYALEEIIHEETVFENQFRNWNKDILDTVAIVARGVHGADLARLAYKCLQDYAEWREKTESGQRGMSIETVREVLNDVATCHQIVAKL